MTISVRGDALMAAIASSVVSVGASSSAVSASMRAQSTATLPFPITTTRSCERSNSSVLEVGVAVVPGDECGGRPGAGQVLARDPQRPVGLRADGVDDGVVELQQLVVRDDVPTSTLPKKRKPGRAAVFSNARETALMFSWSGATPRRTSPHGVGRRSITSTSTRGSSLFSRASAA